MQLYRVFTEMSFYDKILVVGGIANLLLCFFILLLLLWRKARGIRIK
jgi:hypothetical protein